MLEEIENFPPEVLFVAVSLLENVSYLPVLLLPEGDVALL